MTSIHGSHELIILGGCVATPYLRECLAVCFNLCFVKF